MEDVESAAQRQLSVLWRGRWLIIATVLVCAAIAALAAYFMPKQYEASVLLSPISPDKGGSFGASTSELSGLAALAGLSLGNDSAKSEAIAVLQSEELTESYIKDNNLIPIIFSDDWDTKSNNWKNPTVARKHTLWMTNRFFDKNIRKVVGNGKTGLLNLTIFWRDPVQAAKWANGMVKMANDFLRENAIRQSERNIAYLNEEAAKTNVVEERRAIFGIMERELTKAMVARGSEEYAFKVIDPATVPELPSSPKKALWIVGGAFLGLLLSSVVISLRSDKKT